jgi:hypothetical protein
MLHVRWRGEMHIGFWLVNLKESGDLEDLVVGGKIILRQILNK